MKSIKVVSFSMKVCINDITISSEIITQIANYILENVNKETIDLLGCDKGIFGNFIINVPNYYNSNDFRESSFIKRLFELSEKYKLSLLMCVIVEDEKGVTLIENIAKVACT